MMSDYLRCEKPPKRRTTRDGEKQVRSRKVGKQRSREKKVESRKAGKAEKQQAEKKRNRETEKKKHAQRVKHIYIYA